MTATAPGSESIDRSKASAPARPPVVVGGLPEASDLDEPTTPDLITLDDFNCYYGSFHALKNINLRVPENKVTAFIGPSGCGKSTLLRWINRMNDLIPSARATGNMMLHGENLLASNMDVVGLRRRIGMVFQKPNPFPKSIFDNVAFGPRLHLKVNRSQTEEIVERSLKGAALWDEVKDRLKASALSLSGGQQQRLCIARAIAADPEVLLMDEPCSALDPIATAKVEELIQELKKTYTILIVTHSMQQASRASDRCAFLYMGELIEDGPTRQIFTNPAHQQTEDYISGRFG